MPQIPKQHKIKRATLLTKRPQYLGKIPLKRSYKSLYEKLKGNNIALARALSKEKQECRLLFSQNVALAADIQDLSLACNKRDSVISNVLKNSKEMLKMFVTMTGYITNTISLCQEFVSSGNANVQIRRNSSGKRDSCRLSTKSPARGVVKPMVSGHTITKPTINLSRVNMQRVNVQSNLSTVQESPATPNRSQERNDIRSPVSIPINRPIRCEPTRTCRLPERLIVTSPRPSNEEDERRLSRRSSRYSGRLSGRHSRPKSSRLSGNHVARHSLENMEQIGSPRVELNDVSKLLQNSHSVNVKMLTENVNNSVTERETRDDTMHNNSASDTSSNDITMHNNTTNSLFESHTSGNELNEDRSMNSMETSLSETQNRLSSNKSNHQAQENKSKQDTSSSWEDPLEGPSWLHNEDQSSNSRHENRETNNFNISSGNSSFSKTFNVSNRVNETMQNNQTLPYAMHTSQKCTNRMSNFVSEESSTSDDSDSANHDEDDEDNNYSSGRDAASYSPKEKNTREEPETANLTRFVTQRRGRTDEFEEDDVDDFTLVFKRKSEPNYQFDLNDLRLPVLEGPIVPSTISHEPEPEITTTVRGITENCAIPSVSNNTINDPIFEQSMVKLPMLHNIDQSLILTPANKRSQVCRKKKRKNADNTTEKNNVERAIEKSKNERKKKLRDDKDPSAVKVVLQKLNDEHVRSKSSTSEDDLRDLNYSLERCPSSFSMNNSSDSECSVENAGARPKRRKAPVNMKEPSLRRKLRRDQ